MLNKFKKIIHNKYSEFFRFIFFLRYLFAVFFTSIALFFTIPALLDFEKKIEPIKSHLAKNYDLTINNYNNVKYRVFPLPTLELTNVSIRLKAPEEILNIESLKIYPKLLSIYNFENFQTNKIILKNNDLKLNLNTLKLLIKNLLNQKNKIVYNNLKINVIDRGKIIINLENIKFKNFGNEKNLIKGRVFGQKFKTEISEDLKNVNFQLLKSGIKIKINFDKNQKNNFTRGIFKSKILNTNLKFNFDYDDNKIKIFNSYFRNKDLSFNNEGYIILSPFFYANLKFLIEDFDLKILKNINASELRELKEIIKKINLDNEIKFTSKKFSNNFLDNINLKTKFAYGRLNYNKKFTISDNLFECEGNINLLDEIPLLFFNCLANINDKKKLFKKFNIKSKGNNESINLYIKGNYNILNKKINFKNISYNNFKSSKEDLMYFKNSFETIILKRSFLQIFNINTIKKFILEIS